MNYGKANLPQNRCCFRPSHRVGCLPSVVSGQLGSNRRYHPVPRNSKTQQHRACIWWLGHLRRKGLMWLKTSDYHAVHTIAKTLKNSLLSKCSSVRRYGYDRSSSGWTLVWKHVRHGNTLQQKRTTTWRNTQDRHAVMIKRKTQKYLMKILQVNT